VRLAIQRKSELERFLARAALACATKNLLSWFRWCPFLVTFLGKQKSDKTINLDKAHLMQQALNTGKTPAINKRLAQLPNKS
jgi:hypothetical protein